MEAEDSLLVNLNQSMLVSGSPPQSGRSSPPLSSTPLTLGSGTDAVELQIDYWPITKPIEGKEKVQTKDKEQGKNSIKSQFRSLQVIEQCSLDITKIF